MFLYRGMLGRCHWKKLADLARITAVVIHTIRWKSKSEIVYLSSGINKVLVSVLQYVQIWEISPFWFFWLRGKKTSEKCDSFTRKKKGNFRPDCSPFQSLYRGLKIRCGFSSQSLYKLQQKLWRKKWGWQIYSHTDKTVPSVLRWQIVCRLGSRPRWSDCLRETETFWSAAPPSGHRVIGRGEREGGKKSKTRKKKMGEGRHREER